jgi:putative transposase
MRAAIREQGARVGVAPLCRALGVSRASVYRRRGPRHGVRRPSPRALRVDERQAVRALLHAPRFVDLAPPQVYATLLDEGRYLCSIRTMYRILAAHGEVHERRTQRRHPVYTAPQLLATRPNQLWSWDITKLLGPATWTYFYLYVILDVFSRYVVGWMVAEREAASLAEALIAETCARQGIVPGQLTLHADRGASMRSKPVALLLADLGVTKTHSRPYTATDNPFSEAQFRTLKYRPGFPDRFGSLPHARMHSGDFFHWYNTEHYHSALGWHTPADVHAGRADIRAGHRAVVLAAAHAATPERFVRGLPQPLPRPTAVWINPPSDRARQRPLTSIPTSRHGGAATSRSAGGAEHRERVLDVVDAPWHSDYQIKGVST